MIRTATVAVLGLLCSCRRDMQDQPRYKPLEASRFFADGRSARTPPAGAIARGFLRADRVLYTGRTGATDPSPVSAQAENFPPDLAKEFPFPIDRDVLLRGRNRFEIFCTPCHGFTGDGRGMIVQRGFSAPPTFHSERLRGAPPGHFFDVITNGYGAMYSYASRVAVRDRWAIAAYIRALQLSQNPGGAP